MGTYAFRVVFVLWCHVLFVSKLLAGFGAGSCHFQRYLQHVWAQAFNFQWYLCNMCHAPCSHMCKFMRITTQWRSAVKNCDIHVLLQHSCDAMRSRACTALCWIIVQASPVNLLANLILIIDSGSQGTSLIHQLWATAHVQGAGHCGSWGRGSLFPRAK